MVPGYNKITRKKSEMDVDPSSSQEARITAADFSFGLLEAKQEGHVFVQEDTVFTPPYSDGSDYASPEHLPDVDQLTDMAVSQAPQPTQQSDMSIEELDSETDTVCMPGTREPTPMPGVPQVSTQYLSRMESIHQLGPAVSAVPQTAPPQVPLAGPDGFWQRYLLAAQQAQDRQLEVLAAFSRTIQEGMHDIAQEIRSLREEVAKARDTQGDCQRRRRSPRVLVAHHPR